ncbi:MAG: TauD/TfdA family dioxygenase [Caulobacteraceae bacterium]
MTDEEHIRFSRAFGPLELPPGMGRPRPVKRRMAPEMFDASNLDENGEIIPYDSERRALSKGAERFHTDSSFNSLPTKWSLLRGCIVPPEGGDHPLHRRPGRLRRPAAGDQGADRAPRRRPRLLARPRAGRADGL